MASEPPKMALEPPKMALEPPEMAPEPSKTPKIPMTLDQCEMLLLRTLEISRYELVVLRRHLVSHGWIPESTDNSAIHGAVFKSRESFLKADCHKFPEHAGRLNKIFDAYPIDEEDFIEEGWTKEAFFDKLRREDNKYDAVRFMIAQIAISESRKRGNVGKAS